MQNKTRKRGPLTSEDQFDLKEAKTSYVAMPSWQRIAIWLALGMLLLYVEVLKAARLGIKSVMDHVLSFILFVAMAGELVLVPRAATPTLLLLTVLGFVDLIAGVSVAARPHEQEIVIEGADRAPV